MIGGGNVVVVVGVGIDVGIEAGEITGFTAWCEDAVEEGEGAVVVGAVPAVVVAGTWEVFLAGTSEHSMGLWAPLPASRCYRAGPCPSPGDSWPRWWDEAAAAAAASWRSARRSRSLLRARSFSCSRSFSSSRNRSR